MPQKAENSADDRTWQAVVAVQPAESPVISYPVVQWSALDIQLSISRCSCMISVDDESTYKMTEWKLVYTLQGQQKRKNFPNLQAYVLWTRENVQNHFFHGESQ